MPWDSTASPSQYTSQNLVGYSSPGEYTSCPDSPDAAPHLYTVSNFHHESNTSKLFQSSIQDKNYGKQTSPIRKETPFHSRVSYGGVILLCNFCVFYQCQKMDCWQQAGVFHFWGLGVFSRSHSCSTMRCFSSLCHPTEFVGDAFGASTDCTLNKLYKYIPSFWFPCDCWG